MEWYLSRDNRQVGPLAEEELFRMGREGEISPADYVWNETMLDWAPAESVPGLLAQNPARRGGVPSTGDSGKEAILQQLLQYSDAGPFKISRGKDTDLVITNEVADSSWFSGKKKVTYTAQLLLKESEKTAYYWEMLKESSAGLSFGAGFKKGKIKGIEVFEQRRERGYSPTGELVYDYQFDYGSLRDAFKRLLESQGWKFKLVLMRGKTIYGK